MRALVTGGAGFIGSHLVKKLFEEGYGVRVADIAHGQDLMDPKVAEEAVKGADIVFHLAADSSVGASLTNHTKDLGGPTIIMNLLESMSRNGVKDMVFASSSAVYGEPKVIPTTEDCEKNPISLYGAAKLSSEAFARAFVEIAPIRVCALRFGNPVGEGARKGVVWSFTRRLIENPNVLEVLGDGQQTRCFFYVGDCVTGMLAAYKSMKGNFDVFNVAYDRPTTLSKAADIIIDEMGVPAKKVFKGGERGWVGDIRTSDLSVDKLRSTGWRPEYTPEEAIRRAVRWSRSQS